MNQLGQAATMPPDVLMEIDERERVYRIVYMPTDEVLAQKSYDEVAQWRYPGRVMTNIAQRAMRQSGLVEEVEEQEEQLIPLWDLLSVSLLILGLLTFWMALAVGMWVGPFWGVLGLFIWSATWIFAVHSIEKGAAA